MECPKCKCKSIRLRRTYNCDINDDGTMLELDNYNPLGDVYFCDDCDYWNKLFGVFK